MKKLLPIAVATALSASVATSQDYPNKTIRIITNAAGGDSDVVARQIAQGISGHIGQSVIVDNRGNSLLSIAAASQAPPDGYTLFVSGTSTWVGPILRKTPYPDFVPISLLLRQVAVLVVHPSLPVKSVRELIALAKARPGELNYSSSGIGSTGQLAGDLFNSMAGVNIVRVAYKGQPLAIAAVVSGEVQMTIYDAGLVAPLVKSGRLRALAITSAEPSMLVPDLPTIAASGVPGYEAVSITGVWAPAGTPTVIINRLNKEIVRVFNLPDVKARFLNAGAETVGSSPEQFAAFIKSDMAKMSKIIKDAGIDTN